MKLNIPKKQLIAILVIVVVGAILAGAILAIGKPAASGEEHGHAEHSEGKGGDKHGHDEHESAQAKGPHGGQLFEENDFGLEVALNEEGGEPHFRVFLYQNDKPVAPNTGKVTISVTRPDGEKQAFALVPEKDYLKSTAPVEEPHVFNAQVTAQAAGKTHEFSFAQEEGKVALSDEQVKAAGVTVNTAGAASISTAVVLPGEIRYNEDRTAHVVPRLSGVVERVDANLGQQVKKGQVLAVIASSGLSEQRSELLTAQKRLALAKTTYEREKKLWQDKISAEQDYLQAQQALQEAEIAVRNAQQKLNAVGARAGGSGTLNTYEIRAPFDGTVMEKHISLGEAVKEDADVFTISDLSTVWAEVAVPPKDLNMVRVGGTAKVKASAFDAQATGTVSYVGSLLGEQTRTAKARVVLSNPDMAWRPGLFVNVEIQTNQVQVPVAVTADAIHTVNDKPTLFVRIPGGFLPQQVTLGRSDGKVVEVVKGLKAGAQYAGAGSFVVKSELGKASAEHEH